jgi:lipoate-protein ligase A
MKTWRIVPTQVSDAFTNMAVDEAILESRIRKKVPNTVRFYRWNPSAVSIGRFQSIDKEVNLDTCRRMGVDVVRRASGGGAVYHDYARELTYSVVVDCDEPHITSDLLTSYKAVCDGILRGLALLGVHVELDASDPSQRCPNIMIKGKKVSGNAQARRRGVLLQHGTILLDLDIETMLTVLRNPKLIINDTVVEFVRHRITTLSRELNRDIGFDEVADSLRRGFSEAFDIDLIKEKLTGEEVVLAEEFRVKRYTSHDWNYAPQRFVESGGSGFKPGEKDDTRTDTDR